jgi:hypothetical protein
MTKLIIDCTTGEITERELNAQEIAQQEIDEANIQAIAAAREAEVEAKAQAKATAEGKLAALGLTTDDLRALGL